MNQRATIILLFILLLLSLFLNGILGTVLYRNILRMNHTMHHYPFNPGGPGRPAAPERKNPGGESVDCSIDGLLSGLVAAIESRGVEKWFKSVAMRFPERTLGCLERLLKFREDRQAAESRPVHDRRFPPG